MTYPKIFYPMNEETNSALEDCFVDNPNMNARKFVFENLAKLCQDAKRCLRLQSTPVNRKQKDTGQLQQEEYSLKGVNMDTYEIDLNPEWLPDELTKDENNPVELTLRENTEKYLKSFCKLALIRHEQYNESEEKYYEAELATKQTMLNTITGEAEKKSYSEQIVKWEEAQEKERKRRISFIPSCFEETLFMAINPIIMQTLDANDSKVFTTEYAETYEKDESTSKA